MVIILLVAVLIFGGAKIPDLARSLGAAKREFEQGQAEGRPAEPDPEADDRTEDSTPDPT